MAAPALTGTPVEIDSALNSGSQAITVPADCTGIAVCVGGYGDGSANYFSGGSVTLNSVGLTSYGAGDDSASFHQNGIFWLASPSTGSQTLAWDWVGTTAPADGVIIVAAFVTGSATTTEIRDSDGLQGASPTVTSKTLTAQTDDLILAWGEEFNNSGPTLSWTGATKFSDYQAVLNGFRNTSGSLATALPTGNQTVAWSFNSSDGGLSALVIKPAAGGGAGQTVSAVGGIARPTILVPIK